MSEPDGGNIMIEGNRIEFDLFPPRTRVKVKVFLDDANPIIVKERMEYFCIDCDFHTFDVREMMEHQTTRGFLGRLKRSLWKTALRNVKIKFVAD